MARRARPESVCTCKRTVSSNLTRSVLMCYPASPSGGAGFLRPPVSTSGAFWVPLRRDRQTLPQALLGSTRQRPRWVPVPTEVSMHPQSQMIGPVRASGSVLLRHGGVSRAPIIAASLQTSASLWLCVRRRRRRAMQRGDVALVRRSVLLSLSEKNCARQLAPRIGQSRCVTQHCHLQFAPHTPLISV